MNFLSQLHTRLIKNGFSPAHTNNPAHPLASFTKEEGSAWYVVLAVDLSAISFDDFISLNDRYTRFYTGLPANKKPQHIYIINTLITNQENQQVSAFIQGLAPFSKENVNNIYWALDLSTGHLLMNKNNPTQILNLRDILQDSYQNKISGLIDPDISSATKNAPLTLAIMTVNVLIYLIVLLTGGSTPTNLLRLGALFPYLVFQHAQIWRIFTATFLHASLPHLIMNMFSLYIFGRIVERFYHRSAFIIIFMVSGIFGSLFSLYLSATLSVGASGVIFGMAGAVAVLSKLAKTAVDGLNFQTLFIFIVLNLTSGLILENVDNWGHVGGLIGGSLAGFIICKHKEKTKNNREK